MQADLAKRDALEQRLERRRQELMAQYKVAAMDAVPVGFQGISIQEGENHGNEVFDRHYGRLFDAYAAQNRVFQAAGFAAPMLPIRSLSMGLAGTDFAHHREFVGAAEDYRRRVQRMMNDDITRNARPGVAYTAGSALWAQVPDFVYTMPTLSWVLERYALSLLLLAAWFAASVWFAVQAGMRMTID
jgi:ABC-2 type transport system permease protein